MGNTKAILLIEDNRSDQLLFARALRDLENVSMYGVANNGREAIDMLCKADARLPDIIFTDINMPGMDGIECIEHLSKLPVIKNIPVIVLSTDTAKSAKAHRVGAMAFIKKPDDIDVLRERIGYMVNLVASQTDSQTFEKGFYAQQP